MTLITNWRLQMLGRECQKLREEQRNLIRKDLISRV